MTTKFRFNDLEPKNEHGCCASVLVWEDHAYFMARLESCRWAAVHFHDGKVTVLTPPGGVQSGHRAYNIALEDKNAMALR
jgi:hypothetical protein